ncbi:N-acetyltransferase [Parashewanella spongiae]|uniref:N-acetyltransferase n=1 Tax=Parashewanella spongiae TaxID=342950 RepID=A0A3A6TD82_9GAMM|nr:GNAT family N-acetyltransferase [Parashewanella spongiae]MCL1079979.1 GNAT family N-acetyltransferase [Parashewanella spongiae]RJY05989.1 N-acetyltransferase [Parashewanella spongiae]
MTKIITETERLIIREFTLEDAEDVFMFNSNNEVNRFTGDDCLKSIEDAKKIIREIWLYEYQKYGYARWATELKETGKVIGFTGFKFETRSTVQATDIGYRFLPEYWGQGLATESGLACIEYAKKHMSLEQILGDVVVDNTGSSNVLKKLGFSYHSQYQELDFILNRYELIL